jgi:hypothetical protein
MPRRRKSLSEPALSDAGIPFPSLDDEEGLDPEASAEAAAIADEVNNPHRVDLTEHEPPPVGGFGASPSPLGFGGFGGYGEPPPMPGRPTSPPIWASAHLHENIPQIRVWKRVNGVLILVGDVDAKIETNDFVRHFSEVMPKPGEGSATFVIRPIDLNGREVREEVTLPPISEHHSELRKLRAVAAGGAPVPALDLSPLHALVAKQQEMTEARMRAMEEEAKEARRSTTELQAKLVEQQIELAQRGAMATEAITERMLKAEADRSERTARAEQERNDRMLEVERARASESVNLTTGMFTQLTTMQQQAWERERTANDQRMREESDRRQQERDDAKLRLERERLEWEQRWQREKAEEERKWQREKADRDEHARMLEAERQRQHDARMEEMRLQAQRDKEHAERMMALSQRENKNESVEGLLEKGVKLLSVVAPGASLGDVVGRLFQKEEEGPNPLVELGLGALKEGMKVAGEYVRSNAQVKAQQVHAQAAAAGAGMSPFAMVPAGLLPPPAPGVVPFMPGAQPEMVPAGPGGEEMPEAPAPASEPGADLPLSVKKPARRAIRELVGKMRGSSPDQWADLVATAVANELSIYHYVKEVSLRYALKEAGADDAFVASFFLHPSCALIPAEVPRD